MVTSLGAEGCELRSVVQSIFLYPLIKFFLIVPVIVLLLKSYCNQQEAVCLTTKMETTVIAQEYNHA